MGERPPAEGRWEQLNKCPVCGADMARVPHVGEQLGLYYRCATHGRFRYSWDADALERAPEEAEGAGGSLAEGAEGRER